MAIKFGDTSGTLSEHTKAHNQTLNGDDNQSNELYGDSHALTDHAKGGDDTLIGGNNSTSNNEVYKQTNSLYGDSYSMVNQAQGGGSTLAHLLNDLRVLIRCCRIKPRAIMVTVWINRTRDFPLAWSLVRFLVGWPAHSTEDVSLGRLSARRGR